MSPTPQVSLAPLTTLRVGGLAEWFSAPASLEQLQADWAWARDQGLPVTFLGAGSNLLVSDRGLPGLVISSRNLHQTSFDPATGQVRALAGQSLVHLARQAAKRGWQGIEWAVGIPGTVGGSVVMNAGAHQGCTADVLVSADVLTNTGEHQVWGARELGYSYRTSSLQAGGYLVTQATFQLVPGADPQRVIATTQELLHQRHSTQPYDWPSCGSVFRNPAPHSAGWLIEQTGLKGYRLGGAQVAHRHANFILNVDQATATDVFKLIRHVQARVLERWAIHLQPEVRLWGDFGEGLGALE